MGVGPRPWPAGRPPFLCTGVVVAALFANLENRRFCKITFFSSLVEKWKPPRLRTNNCAPHLASDGGLSSSWKQIETIKQRHAPNDFTDSAQSTSFNNHYMLIAICICFLLSAVFVPVWKRLVTNPKYKWKKKTQYNCESEMQIQKNIGLKKQ